MEPSTVRVLVVDDYEPFRRFVCSTLGKRPEWQIVGQASDGLEAVQKAEELQPDLIVLDLGLPTLHGIEAARRIRFHAVLEARGRAQSSPVAVQHCMESKPLDESASSPPNPKYSS